MISFAKPATIHSNSAIAAYDRSLFLNRFRLAGVGGARDGVKEKVEKLESRSSLIAVDVVFPDFLAV